MPKPRETSLPERQRPGLPEGQRPDVPERHHPDLPERRRRDVPARRRLGVLITRPDEGAQATARMVVARGFAAILAPVLAIRPLHHRLPRAEALQAVVLTSANALAALGPGQYGVRVLAVGDATAARARAAGFTDVVSAGGNGIDLAKLVLRSCTPSGGALLLPTARHEGQELSRVLREAGFTVQRRWVYEAVPQNRLADAGVEALSSGAVDLALFFSPATARHFVQLLPAALPAECLHEVDALALSAKVAAPLARLPWRSIQVAAKPTQEAVLALLPRAGGG